MQSFKIKAQILAAIREFFAQKGFEEVVTPLLVKHPDPSLYHEVFEVRSSGQIFYLTPSPEIYLKKLIVQGAGNIYEITHSFRENEAGPQHVQEFAILEWYRNGADYQDLINDCQQMVAKVGQKIGVTTPRKPYPKITCQEAFGRYAEVDLVKFLNINKARFVCRKKGYRVTKMNTWEQLYHQVFLNEIEPKLTKLPGVFLYDYPPRLAELAQTKKTFPYWAERVEFYLNGLEVGNGYSELTDWQEQEKRFKKDLQDRKRRGMKVFDYDHEFIAALKRGLPKTAGMAIGIERLMISLTGIKDIRDVAFYAL